MFIYIYVRVHIFPEKFESRLQISCPFNLLHTYTHRDTHIAIYIVKNKNTVLHNNSTVVKGRKFNLDAILLSNILSIHRFCQSDDNVQCSIVFLHCRFMYCSWLSRSHHFPLIWKSSVACLCLS